MVLKSNRKDAEGGDSRREHRGPPTAPSRKPADYEKDYPVPGSFNGNYPVSTEPETTDAPKPKASSNRDRPQRDEEASNTVPKGPTEEELNNKARRPRKLSRKDVQTSEQAGPSTSSATRNVPTRDSTTRREGNEIPAAEVDSSSYIWSAEYADRVKEALESDNHFYGGRLSSAGRHWKHENVMDKTRVRLDQKPIWELEYSQAFGKLSLFHRNFETTMKLHNEIHTLVSRAQAEEETARQELEQTSKGNRNAKEPTPPQRTLSLCMKTLVEKVEVIESINRSMQVSIIGFEVYERFLSDELWKVPSYRGLMKQCRLLIEHGEQTKWNSTNSKKIKPATQQFFVEDLSIDMDNAVQLRNAHEGIGCAGWKTCLEDAEYALRHWRDTGYNRYYWQDGSWRIVN